MILEGNMKYWLIVIMLMPGVLFADAGFYQNTGASETNNIVIDQGSGNEAKRLDTEVEGVDYGSMSSSSTFTLKGGDGRVWKDNSSDVTGVSLYYRVYKSGASPPSFTEVSFGWQSNDGNNQYWATTGSSIDLLTSVNSAGTWKVEFYMSAPTNAVNCSNPIYWNNSSSNYTLTFTADSSLPVELSAFSAHSSSKGVKLIWTTDSEIENQGFSILRKSQDKDWGELATFTKSPELVGQGSTTEATEYYFIDTQVKEGESYSYQLVDIDYQGKLTYHKDHIQSITFVRPAKDGKSGALKVTKLYPNPFNPTVTLTYDLEEMSDLQVSIYNLAGEQVWKHAKGNHPAGQDYTLAWNGIDMTNTPLPSGIYLVNIQAGTQIKSEKVTLLR
jgi:hypothetical protein